MSDSTKDNLHSAISTDPDAASGKAGQQPVLDAQKRGRICGMIAMGSSRREAARAVGCHASTISRTMERDGEFADQVREAEVLSRTRPLRAMYDAVEKHWRAAAWMLERTRPDEFERRRPHTYTQREVRELVDRLLEEALPKVPDPAAREEVERLADGLIEPPIDTAPMTYELAAVVRSLARQRVEVEAREKGAYDV